MQTKPSVLVARAVFPEVLHKLEQHFSVESNQDDIVFSSEELARRLQGKAFFYTACVPKATLLETTLQTLARIFAGGSRARCVRAASSYDSAGRSKHGRSGRSRERRSAAFGRLVHRPIGFISSERVQNAALGPFFTCVGLVSTQARRVVE